MSDIFASTAPGTLVAIEANNPQGVIFDFGPVQTTGVVIGFNASGSVAAQFQPSLNGSVYVTPFGDNVGKMSIDLLLNSACSGSSDTLGPDNVSGFLQVYQNTRLSPDNPIPSTLIIGQQSFTGYAIGFQLTGSSDNGNMLRGQLEFVAWMSN
jgi:hypothetical protein